jgi:hypothetical protein
LFRLFRDDPVRLRVETGIGTVGRRCTVDPGGASTEEYSLERLRKRIDRDGADLVEGPEPRESRVCFPGISGQRT